MEDRLKSCAKDAPQAYLPKLGYCVSLAIGCGVPPTFMLLTTKNSLCDTAGNNLQVDSNVSEQNQTRGAG